MTTCCFSIGCDIGFVIDRGEGGRERDGECMQTKQNECDAREANE